MKLKPGDEFSFERIITLADVFDFVRLSGDTNPLHLSTSYAQAKGFSGPVVQGMLVASMASKLIGQKLTGGGALWMEQAFRFKAPVFPDDNLRFKVKVLQISKVISTVKVDLVVTKKGGQVVLSGQGTVKVLRDGQGGEIIGVYPRLAFVTGASRGIGKAIALRLARQGIAVGINYLAAMTKAKEVVGMISEEGGLAMAVKADVRKQSDILRGLRKCAKRFGSVIDVLVCNASGAIVPGGVQTLGVKAFANHWETQLVGAVNAVSGVVPGMVERGWGRIIIISSTAWWGVPPSGWAAYVSAKAALTAYARSLALELGPKGITVNVVSPGMTETDFISHIPEKVRPVLAAQIPRRRLGRPEDVAGVVAFLARPESDYITGADIPVAGGAAMR